VIKQGFNREVRVETGACLLVYVQFTVLSPFFCKRINNVYRYVPLLVTNVTVFLDITHIYDLVFESI
jgi:hypothetical protein